MRLLIQRVNYAQVAVDGNICGKIGKSSWGFVFLRMKTGKQTRHWQM